VYVTALPLLAATLTRDPLPVSAVMFAEWLPWLLFGLPAGALLDRWERRRVMWTVDAGRLVVVGGFAVAVLAGWASVPLLMAAGFLLGTGQTVVDTASQALVPSLVSRDPGRLGRANGRLAGTRTVAEELAGPPAGGFLFSASAWLPFAADAVSFGASSALVAAIGGRPVAGGGPTAPAGRPRSLRAEIAEGLGWLWRRHALRLLAVCLGVMNLAGAGTFAIWVLWARQRLGLEDVGFGALVTAYAAGGLLGTLVASRLDAAVGPAVLLRAGLCTEAACQLALALTRSPWIAGATLVVFGAHAMVWGTVTVSLRGRVNSVSFLFDLGGAALGTLLGGGLAAALGITAPFWLASGAVTVLTVVAWRRFRPDALTSPPAIGLDST